MPKRSSIPPSRDKARVTQTTGLPRTETSYIPRAISEPLALQLLAGNIPLHFASALVQLRSRLEVSITRSELFQQHQSKAVRIRDAGGSMLIETPEDALGEREHICCCMMLVAEDFKFALIPNEAKPEQWPHAKQQLHQEAAIYAVYELLDASEVFLWTFDIVQGALAMTLPDHVFGREGFQAPFMWWTFRRPLIFSNMVAQVDGLLIVSCPDWVELFYLFGPTKATDNCFK